MSAPQEELIDEEPIKIDPIEVILYIIEMVEQLAKMAARYGSKDLASDLFVVATEARARIRGIEH